MEFSGPEILRARGGTTSQPVAAAGSAARPAAEQECSAADWEADMARVAVRYCAY
jgi:hypothetical protein